MHQRPRLLCMVWLDRAPQLRTAIERVADVEYAAPDYDGLLARVHEFDAYWGEFHIKVDKAVLDRGQRLKVVCTATTGTDHIDKVECRRRGIRVLSNTADLEVLERFTATAEMAFLQLLAIVRQLRTAWREAQSGVWPGQEVMGEQVSELTLGVLGVGRLGRMTCRFGKAFCQRVIACDVRPFEIEGVEAVDFDTLLGESDAVSIHIHLTPENHHLFNRATIAKMKPGAILINTSRGDIIDESALLEALESGQLGGFGADVLHDEWRDTMAEHPVVRYAAEHENVILTPHVGGKTVTSVREARLHAAQKLAAVLKDLR